jgi:hypothetical protein
MLNKNNPSPSNPQATQGEGVAGRFSLATQSVAFGQEEVA